MSQKSDVSVPMEAEVCVHAPGAETAIDRVFATPLKECMKMHPAIMASSDTTVGEAMTMMISKNIGNVAVAKGESRMLESFFDVLALSKFTVSQARKFSAKAQGDQDLQFAIDSFLGTTLKHIMDGPEKLTGETSLPCADDVSVLTALKEMLFHEHHRIGVMDHKGALQSVLVQSHFMNFLKGNLANPELKCLEVIPACEIRGGTSVLASICEDAPALEGFALMNKHNLGGIAVLDGQGGLVDTLSIRDVLGVGQKGENFGLLFKSVKEFKVASRNIMPAGYKGKPVMLPIDSTVGQLVDAMLATWVHRVFLFDKSAPKKAVDLVTFTDILRLCLLHSSYGAAMTPFTKSGMAVVGGAGENMSLGKQKTEERKMATTDTASGQSV